MISSTGVRVKKVDVLAAGYCPPAMRVWCRQHGFTSDDVNQGIPEEMMLATGCELAAHVVEIARKRHMNSGDHDV